MASDYTVEELVMAYAEIDECFGETRSKVVHLSYHQVRFAENSGLGLRAMAQVAYAEQVKRYHDAESTGSEQA